MISPWAPPGAVTAYPSHALRAAFDGKAFSFPVSPATGISTMFLEDVIDSIVDYCAADAARLREHAYNLHGYFLSAEMVAEAATARFPRFEYRFEPVAAVERLMNGWPDVIDDSAARRDWGWQPGFDFERSADRICELLRAENNASD